MSRAALIVALGALAVLGAAGLSGFLLDDPCPIELPEGTNTSYGARLWPPGRACHAFVPTGTDTAGRFLYADRPRVISAGSAVGFLAALAVAGIVAALVRRAWPAVPRGLRLAACSSLVLACLGAGAIVAPALGVMVAFCAGVPIAAVANRRLARRPGAGIAGVAAGVLTLVAALALWVVELSSAAALATVLALVAAGAAASWGRLPAARPRGR